MKRVIGTTIAGALLAGLAGPRGPLGGFWAPAPSAPHPRGALLAGFLAENLVENIAFGLGLAILLLGRPWFVARTADTARATTGWLATVWLFASWMPHAALHLHIGMRPVALLPVEWVFHGGAIMAIAALLWALSSPPTRISAEDPYSGPRRVRPFLGSTSRSR